jgi:hypothetical protein
MGMVLMVIWGFIHMYRYANLGTVTTILRKGGRERGRIA